MGMLSSKRSQDEKIIAISNYLLTLVAVSHAVQHDSSIERETGTFAMLLKNLYAFLSKTFSFKLPTASIN